MPGVRFTDVRRFGTIDSTNRYLLDEARAGAPAGVVAVAEHQSAGRGRLGRRWEAPPGSNLLMSVLLRPGLPPDEWHLASAALCLAAVDGVRDATGLVLSVKWPNDLHSPEGLKVAGVLAEADLGGAPAGAPPPVVVGIGLNVNWPGSERDLPPELAGLATSLRLLTGREVDRTVLLDRILGRLADRAVALESPSGRSALADDLGARCTTVGARVRVDLPHRSFEGTATGLTPSGHLSVDEDGVAVTVVAGDVVHIRPAGGPPADSGGVPLPSRIPPS
jgi:BirA family biotin operon repressor/biotin-[acetyl-CoA-carboxylase] ligase